MNDDRTLFVAIIGGLWQLDEAQAGKAKQTGEALGRELARAGFGLVVYFSNEESLEPHVVSGYVASLKEGQRLIRVRYPSSLRGKIKFKEEANRPELFEHMLFPGDDWEAPFYQSLVNEEGLDAVLLLAGATSTLIAGQIAVARRLPILAVDEFDGSAAKVWSQLAHASADKSRESWGTRPVSEFVDRLGEQCREAASVRADRRNREFLLARILSKRTQGIYAAVALVALLCALALGTVFTTAANGYTGVILFGLVAGGAVGAAVRTILAEPGSADPRISVLLGCIAGLVVGLAYLVPQWVAALGQSEPVLVPANNKIQFVSAVLVAISAGVGFDTIFNRLRKQTDDLAVAPPT
jgi:hypothetical protein